MIQQDETRAEALKAQGSFQMWMKEIEAARDREKAWRKKARDCVSIYESEKPDDVPFNILFSNTDTLAPALYNSTPRPQVGRRFKDPDPLGKMAGDALQRVLTFCLDSGDQKYSSFDEVLKSAVLEALVPGRGITWFKYDATFEAMPGTSGVSAADPVGGVNEATLGSAGSGATSATAETSGNTSTGPIAGDNPSRRKPNSYTVNPAVSSYESEEGSAIGAEDADPEERVTNEQVCLEEVPWDRFLIGYAKKWKQVPWIAREHFMTREELVENFGSSIGNECEVSCQEEDAADKEDRDSRESSKTTVPVAAVYEIWDKVTKTVYFISQGYIKGSLKEVEDPLKLSGFFPTPEPLHFVSKIKSMVPVALYTIYENQARELNIITKRITAIVKAIKIRGFYDSTIQGIDKVLNAQDNELVPAANVSALMGASLDRAIWLVPIEKLINVLQELYSQRSQVKQVIYEITGVSDILRGSSVASETATAQKIKSQWGTLRLKNMQKAVMIYARDSLRIMAEIASSRFSEDTFKQMTGLPFPTAQQKMQMQQQIQQMQAAGQQPPQPLMDQVNQPGWDEVMSLLRNDVQRNYRIDIETNSTVDLDATEDKQDIADFLNALAQYLNGVGPAVQAGALTTDAAKAIMLTIVRRFKFGEEVEPYLEQAGSPPAPKPPSPEQQQAQQAMQQQQEQHQATMQQQQMKIQQDQVKAQSDQQNLAVQHQLASAQAAYQVQQLQRQAQLDAAEHHQRMTDLARKNQYSEAQHSLKMKQLHQKSQESAAAPSTEKSK